MLVQKSSVAAALAEHRRVSGRARFPTNNTISAHQPPQCSNSIMAPWVRFSLALSSCAVVALIAWALAESKGPKRPNILFILTDDQDMHMDSLSYMPFLQKHLVQEGLSFSKYFCTVALCCPARGVLWSGQAAHNTNVGGLRVPARLSR